MDAETASSRQKLQRYQCGQGCGKGQAYHSKPNARRGRRASIGAIGSSAAPSTSDFLSPAQFAIPRRRQLLTHSEFQPFPPTRFVTCVSAGGMSILQDPLQNNHATTYKTDAPPTTSDFSFRCEILTINCCPFREFEGMKVCKARGIIWPGCFSIRIAATCSLTSTNLRSS